MPGRRKLSIIATKCMQNGHGKFQQKDVYVSARCTIPGFLFTRYTIQYITLYLILYESIKKITIFNYKLVLSYQNYFLREFWDTFYDEYREKISSFKQINTYLIRSWY